MNEASRDGTQSRALERLNRAIDRATELQAVLLDEQAALAGRDLDALDAIVSRKVDAVEALEAADADLRKAMDRAGSVDDATVASLAERFDALARECSVLNAGNGQVIHARRTHIDQRLIVLRGGSMATPPTYGRHGGTPGTKGQQTLAEA